MEYGLAKKVDIYDFEAQEQSAVIARPSAWYEASLWQANHKGDGTPEEVHGVMGTYVWAYFAIRQAKQLDRYGLPDKIESDTIIKMMDRMTVHIDDLEDEDMIPLAKQRKK